ncbi:hypothetical protein FXO38_10961 [Capsicum annuum]|nr:hypothetical protein FXO37_21709 [Capsicum annuum]KAF3662809.1 hypothetical protein FXO38_10961 [Capsicum annuum]
MQINEDLQQKLGTEKQNLVMKKLKETKAKQKKVVEKWNMMVQHMSMSTSKTSSSRSPKSYTDIVEDEELELVKKSSKWDNFDISRTRNVVFKLEFVAPK